MRIIESSVKIIEQGNTLIDMYKHIEKCARVCYKSEDKTTDTSYEGMIRMLKNNKHLSVLEHGTVYLAIPMTTYAPDAVNKYRDNAYSKVNNCDEFIFTDKYGDEVAAWCVTTNLRVLVENDCLEDLEFLCEPTECHTKRITFNIVCSRSIAMELIRHRACSVSMESQRYVNYNKRGGITFIKPSKLKDVEIPEYPTYIDISNLRFKSYKVIHSWYKSEQTYNELIKLKFKPEEARGVLPNDCKTELMYTMDEDYLINHFLPLRTASTAHPDMQVVANMMKDCYTKYNQNN